MSPLEFMEESVELIQSQLSEHGLFLIPLIQKLHLQQDHAFATIGTHAIGSRDCEHIKAIRIIRLKVGE